MLVKNFIGGLTDGRNHTREVDKLLLDVRDNTRAQTSQHRQRRSLERYNGYMALMSEGIEIEPSYFDEVVHQPVWVDCMVEEYDSIITKIPWEFFPRLVGKSLVGSKWVYKVNHATNGSVDKHKVIYVARRLSHVEGIDYDDTSTPFARNSSIIYILELSM